MRLMTGGITIFAAFTLVLLLPLLGACDSEDGADRSDQEPGDRSTSSLLIGGSTSTPEAIRTEEGGQAREPG